jgi:hypothetical protein
MAAKRLVSAYPHPERSSHGCRRRVGTTQSPELQQITGQTIRDTDVTDDRLTRALSALQPEKTWQGIEAQLADKTISVYQLPPQTIRLDATTVSGYHTGGEESLFQFGKSKDHPELLRVKLMQATLDPLGMPLVTQVVSPRSQPSAFPWRRAASSSLTSNATTRNPTDSSSAFWKGQRLLEGAAPSGRGSAHPTRADRACPVAKEPGRVYGSRHDRRA